MCYQFYLQRKKLSSIIVGQYNVYASIIIFIACRWLSIL